MSHINLLREVLTSEAAAPEHKVAVLQAAVEASKKELGGSLESVLVEVAAAKHTPREVIAWLRRRGPDKAQARLLFRRDLADTEKAQIADGLPTWVLAAVLEDYEHAGAGIPWPSTLLAQVLLAAPNGKVLDAMPTSQFIEVADEVMGLVSASGSEGDYDDGTRFASWFLRELVASRHFPPDWLGRAPAQVVVQVAARRPAVAAKMAELALAALGPDAVAWQLYLENAGQFCGPYRDLLKFCAAAVRSPASDPAVSHRPPSAAGS